MIRGPQLARTRHAHAAGIRRVHFTENGTLVADLAPGFGKDRRMALWPRERLGGAELGWKCRANFPEKVLNGIAAPPCRSRVIELPAR